MSKEKENNNLLANTKGQPLEKHSIAVALYGHLLLKSLRFKQDIEKKINKYLVYAALLHDIGKVSRSFQDYIIKNKNKEKDLENMPTDAESLRDKDRGKLFIGPFHNEISWAYSTNFICFRNENIRKIVCHSIYWHHPANWDDKKDKLHFENAEKVFKNVESKLLENTDELLKSIYNFICDLFKSFSLYYGDNFNFYDLAEPNKNQLREIQCPDFFDHSHNEVVMNAKKQLCLNLLLESDRSVSNWTSDELNSFLNEMQDEKICDWSFLQAKQFLEQWRKLSKVNEGETFSLIEELSSRSKEQFDLAKKMSDKKISVCGVDPAGGKTSIALYWWNESSNTHPLMIALPRQHQVTGLFGSLQKDSKRVYGDKKIKIEGVFNGQIQHKNWENSEDLSTISDINIMVFDRFLSPYYKRSQSSEFIRMLRSHLVLDEFHEFKDIPKMIPSLKEILHIRSWLDSGVKTLMLSGTPEPSLLKLLYIEESDVFQRMELSPRDDHRFKLFLEESSLERMNQFIPDCLYSFLRVESCQEAFARFFKDCKDKISLIHTYFTSKDKKDLLKSILSEHGEESTSSASKKLVVTSKMLQSSYNLSFNKAVLELSQPYMDCQTAGRVNRFGNKSKAEIHLFYDDNTVDFFKENRAGFKNIHESWRKHISHFIEKHNGEIISIRQLMNSYDQFWSDKDNIKKSLEILEKQQKSSIDELNGYVPKRFFPKKRKKISNSVINSNSLFRGESRLLSALEVYDNGEPIDQLNGENLINEGRGWFMSNIEKAMKNCLKTKNKCNLANKIKEQEIFEYNKYINKYTKVFGFKIERPLLCSHLDKEINECLRSELSDADSGKTQHRVYNKRFGLVKESLLKNGR